MPTTELPLNRALLDENAEFGLSELHDLLEMYLAQADEILGELRTAVASGATRDVDQLAHKLAGSSAVCGVTAIIGPLRALEKQASQDELSGADQLLAEADEKLELCRRLLGEYLAEKDAQ
jgi:HPt (histidine-containing phosphotransfer) domain-containing protein